MPAEYYVLRLYRDSNNNVDDVLGTLEEAISGTCWSFKNDAELRGVIDKVTHPENKQTNKEIS